LRKMVGHGVDEEEQRPILALACDEARGGVEIEAVRLHLAGAEVARVEEAVDADRGLEGARAEEGAEPRIETEGLVAAAAHGLRQAALHPAGRHARYELSEAAIGAGRQAGQHVIFGIPSGAAR